MGKTQRSSHKVMEGIRFNPYTCNQCYFNVTMKHSPETELGQQKHWTAKVRYKPKTDSCATLIRSGGYVHKPYSHFRAANIYSPTHTYITVF